MGASASMIISLHEQHMRGRLQPQALPIQVDPAEGSGRYSANRVFGQVPKGLLSAVCPDYQPKGIVADVPIPGSESTS